MHEVKRSGIILVVLSVVLTVLALAIGGNFRLFWDLQWYYLVGALAVLGLAFVGARQELSSASGGHRLVLSFVHGLAATAVCIGLLITFIGLFRTMYYVRHVRVSVGDIVVSLLPLLYGVTIAEVICPVLSHRLGSRIERAEQAALEPERDKAS